MRKEIQFRVGARIARRVAPFALAMACVSSGPREAASAWPANPQANVPLCDTLGHQTQVVAASDGAGGAFVAWIDSRSGVADVYAQRVTAGGEIAAGWPADGVPVCAAAGTQTRVRIASDGAGGALLAWIDFRGGAADLYAQRITAVGAPAAGWPTNGALVCGAPGSQSEVAIASDGAGGAILAWHDSRGASKDVYASRWLAGGTPHASWPADGRLVCGAPGDQMSVALVATGGGASILAWQDSRNNEWDVFAQKLDGEGVAAWAADGVLICSSPGTQEKPRLAVDGGGGAYVCWTDYRDAPTLRTLLLRVLANGSIAPFWPLGGLPMGSAAGSQTEGAVISDGSGGVFVAWSDTRLGTSDIFVGRFDGFGAVPPGDWVESGVPACSAADSQTSPALASDGNGGVYVLWRDARNDPAHDVFGIRITGAGSRADAWIANGMPFGNAPGAQADLALVPGVPGTAIAAWSDFRNAAHWDVYANRLGPEVILGVSPGAASDVFPLRVAPRPMRDLAAIRFVLPRALRTRVTIVDASGRRVRMLLEASLPAGAHAVRWDGGDALGRAAPSGLYFAVLEAGGFRAVESIVRLR